MVQQQAPQTLQQAQGWYLRTENGQQGPYASAKLRQCLSKGMLKLTDQVSRDCRNWFDLQDIPELVPLKLRAELGDRSAQDLLHSRQQPDPSRASSHHLRLSLGAMLTFMLVMSLAIGITIWQGQGRPAPPDDPNCKARPAPGVNWRYCVFSELDVGAASLAGANLNSTILRRAKLMATNLTASDLRYADLRRANLTYAQLPFARMQGANLRYADLSQADLSNADLRHADLTGSRLSGANLTGARLGGAIWIDGQVCAAESTQRCVP